MKLTNQQTEALANKICDEHNKKIEKLAQDRKKVPDVIKKAKAAFAVYNKLDEVAKSVLNKWNGNVYKSLIDAYAAKVPINGHRLQLSDVRREVILASIECKTVDEIVKKVKSIKKGVDNE